MTLTNVHQEGKLVSALNLLKQFIHTPTLRFRWNIKKFQQIETSLTGLRTGPVHRQYTSYHGWINFDATDLFIKPYTAQNQDKTGWTEYSKIRDNAMAKLVSKSAWEHSFANIDWVGCSNYDGLSSSEDTDLHTPPPFWLMSSFQTTISQAAGWTSLLQGVIAPFLSGWGIAMWIRNW